MAGHHHQDERHPRGWRVSPGPDGRGRPPPPEQPAPGGSLMSRFLLFVVMLLAVNLVLGSVLGSGEPPRVRVPYSPVFLEQVQDRNVASISSKGSTIEGSFRRPVTYPAGSRTSTRLFRTEVPTFSDPKALEELLVEKGVEINAKPVDTGRSTIGTLLLSLLPTLLLVGLFVWFLRRAAGGGAMSIVRSRARRVTPTEQRISFKDVAGVEEAKAELLQIVEFLREPEKFRRLGGRIPRGVLLTGPPGTGKTLLARAMAGEAEVPFFSIAASEFVELFVGVGASRVRDLFEQAKADAPAIIFIDELDAIGRARGPGGISGGHEEREQTLNQILTEMDGFDPQIGVIVLAATNRPEVLDKALLRPGRFDRRVYLEPPDTPGRRAILDVHTRSVPLAPDVDLDRLAAGTPGMVGADLANVVNEGALLAARRGHDAVAKADLDDALEKLVLGSERRILMSPAERERTAFHEAGHALVAMLTPGADPVRKVSIIPRGKALGVTLSAPEADRFSYSRSYLTARIDVALAGRAAEELVYDDVSTGAEDDIRQATELARGMARTWGMSEASGPIAVLVDEDHAIAFPAGAERSEEAQELVDREARRAIGEAYAGVSALLAPTGTGSRGSRALIVAETLEGDAAIAAAGVADGTAPRLQTGVGAGRSG